MISPVWEPVEYPSGELDFLFWNGERAADITLASVMEGSHGNRLPQGKEQRKRQPSSQAIPASAE